MSPVLSVDDAELEDSAIGDEEFEFDMRVVESTTRISTECDTSDNCKSTCSTSACNTDSNDPS